MRAIVAVVITAVFGACEVRAGAADVQVGAYTTTFSERSPWSSVAESRRRYGDRFTRESADYVIADEHFEVYVPPSYDGSVAYGLIAYCCPGGDGGARYYAEVMDAQKLIWVGGTNIGNEREVFCRIGLTLDGLYNIEKRYRIDSDRVYVCGMSGGGRVASLMAVTFADVIGGGAIYLCGCNQPIMPADASTLARVKPLLSERRFAFLTGSEDFNRDDTKRVLAAYQGLKLPHLQYLETPGLGHAMHPAEDFTRAIAFCDASLIEHATSALAQGDALLTKHSVDAAYEAYSLAARCIIAPELAASAEPKRRQLADQIDARQARELEHLVAQKAASDKLRAFATRWREFPSGLRAHALAEAAGSAELDAVLTKDAKLQPPALRKLIAQWDGFDVRARAVTELDRHAEPALAAAMALPIGDKRAKALQRVVADWQPTPSAEAARAQLDDDLHAQLLTILAIDQVPKRGQQLQAFVAAWKGTAAGTAAEKALGELVTAVQKAK